MLHEKIIKRENGVRVSIQVSMYLDFSTERANWSISVSICQPGKRTFARIHSNYVNFRSLNTENREKANLLEWLKFVTLAEIDQAKTEAWEKIKPKPTAGPGITESDLPGLVDKK